ncbi:UspA [Rubrobacter xylanophilus DSM 9941]|uniref:UspA n=1 Tax=Rubrobacter xylanophilus (strain DSM 9941 / JCM 11954 / NBRC 16129 / PRD-1) TaxID=266117 RepID=Q1AT37_RUBXD|nr:universal stress protein [Rubrobacter xylanophilus]ABG05441.1 UspA [Rubrobacter xylanophilus DSM 9941]
MIKKIVCATDGSHSAEKAVIFAANLAQQCASHVAFLVVNTITIEKLKTTAGWTSEQLSIAQAQTKAELDYARQAAENTQISFSLHEAEGRDIAKTIVNFAKTNDCDHIIVGSAGRKGLAGVLLGSVAKDVVTYAHCPVTVVR